MKFVHNQTSPIPYTAAYIYDREQATLAMAFSFVSEKDTYSKAIGRKITEGRLDLGLAGDFGVKKGTMKRHKVNDNFRLISYNGDKPIEKVIEEGDARVAELLGIKHEYICSEC